MSDHAGSDAWAELAEMEVEGPLLTEVMVFTTFHTPTAVFSGVTTVMSNTALECSRIIHVDDIFVKNTAGKLPEVMSTVRISERDCIK